MKRLLVILNIMMLGACAHIKAEDEMHTYFVGYDYGMGGIWCFIEAKNPNEIRKIYPNVGIWEEPAFLSEATISDIKLKSTFKISSMDKLFHNALKKASLSDRHYINSIAESL